MDFKEKDWIKHNLLDLAQFHKERCNDPECSIQLIAVRIALENLGIHLTEKDYLILM